MNIRDSAPCSAIARRVAVCISTYRRPNGLRKLLAALNELEFTENPPDVEVVVIDNDAAGSAKGVFEAASESCRWKTHYEVEPRRGIPFARNKAVAYALQHADLIALMDDDETPLPSWLDRLISARHRYDADVVAGPVLSVLPPGTPAWVEKGAHFSHARHANGDTVSHAASGNVLIRSEVFRVVRPHFDERLAYSGGSDSLFFERVRMSGFTMVWADDAVVQEWVPATRATAGWLIRRAYRHGTTLGQRRMALYPFWRAVPSLLWRSFLHFAAGGILLPIGLLRGKHAWVMHLRYLAYAYGIIGGMLGRRYEEYRETHGS